MSIELKPCPFCGVEPDVFQDNIRTWGLLKHREYCLFPCFVNHEIPESDFEAWNTRAEPRTCETCYYYQTVYDRSRPTDRRACFGEHLRVAVGGLDWDEEAEAWAETEPEDYCSKWAPK